MKILIITATITAALILAIQARHWMKTKSLKRRRQKVLARFKSDYTAWKTGKLVSIHAMQSAEALARIDRMLKQ